LPDIWECLKIVKSSESPIPAMMAKSEFRTLCERRPVAGPDSDGVFRGVEWRRGLITGGSG
jgi:hypothetical protein